MAYPTDLNPTLKTDWANNTPVENTHPDEHNNVALDVTALKAKVGANGSAVTTSHDYKLSGITGSDKASSLAGSEILSNKTLTAPKLTNGGFIADANGNELIEATTTANATNHIGTTNAATGNDPLIEAKGSDIDISLKIKAKGTGKVKLGGADIEFPNVDGSSGQVLQTDGSGVLTFSSISSSDITTLVAGEDITANDSLFVAKGDETRQINAYSTDVSASENLGNSTTAWVYQSFTTGPNTTIVNRIRLYGAYSGNSVNSGGNVRIRATPSGVDLATAAFGAGVFLGSEDIDIGPLTVTPNTTYYIVVSKLNTDNFTNKMFRGGTVSSYSGGVSGISSDSGANWTTPSTTVTGDFAFQVLEGDYVAGKAYKTIASTTNNKGAGLTSNFIGFATGSVSAASNVIVKLIGKNGSFSGLTPGSTYYLSNTAGGIAASAGTTSKKIGLALSATDLLIKHDN